jgi:hypothetical protein
MLELSAVFKAIQPFASPAQNSNPSSPAERRCYQSLKELKLNPTQPPKI